MSKQIAKKPEMIPQLKKRLSNYLKKSEKNDKDHEDGTKELEQFLHDRYEIDKKIHSVFELHKKRIKEQEFTDSQLNIWFEEEPENNIANA